MRHIRYYDASSRHRLRNFMSASSLNQNYIHIVVMSTGQNAGTIVNRSLNTAYNLVSHLFLRRSGSKQLFHVHIDQWLLLFVVGLLWLKLLLAYLITNQIILRHQGYHLDSLKSCVPWVHKAHRRNWLL